MTALDHATVPARQATIRVASVPGSHVYVRHLGVPGDGVERLRDPARDPAGSSQASAWWSPRMLEPDWVDANADTFDVFHVHFGFDACTPAALEELVATLRKHGKPFVLTVHDLRNPHHQARGEHDAQLDVLVPAADEVVTLTQGAAREVSRRWGRTATVVPHPHVVEPREVRRLVEWSGNRPDGPQRVGVHVKSLRACMDPVTVLPVVAEAVRQRPGTVLQVDMHTDVFDPDGGHHDPELLSVLEELGDVAEVRVHDYFSDEALWTYLGALDVSVLPYRFGTHSGWLEACRDLGTAVVAPTCGFYAEQGTVQSFVLDEDRFEPDTLVTAVLRALDEPVPALRVEARERQRIDVARVHRELYARLVATSAATERLVAP